MDRWMAAASLLAIRSAEAADLSLAIRGRAVLALEGLGGMPASGARFHPASRHKIEKTSHRTPPRK